MITGKSEQLLSKPYTIVITESLSKKLFGDINVLGKTINDILNNTYTITGVIKDLNKSHLEINALISNTTLKDISNDPNILNDFGDWSNLTYILLEPKSDILKIEQKINSTLSKYKLTNNKYLFFLQSLKQVYFSEDLNIYDGCKHNKLSNIIVSGIVFIIINLIIILNHLNINIILFTARKKEFNINKILGATKTNLLKQSGIEIFILCSITVILSISILEILKTYISNLFDYSLFANTNLTLLFVVSLIYSFLLGLTLLIIRFVNINKKLTIKPSLNRNKINLFFQFLLIGIMACFMLNLKDQIKLINSSDLGIDIKNIVCVDIKDDFSSHRNYIKSELLKNGNIVSASYANSVIFKSVAKRFVKINDKIESSYFLEADSGFMSTMNLQVNKNTFFSETPKCIVNKSFSEKYTSNSKLEVNNYPTSGTVNDFNFRSMHHKVDPLLINYKPDGRFLYIRYLNSNTILKTIDKTIKDINENISYEYSFLEDEVKSSYKEENNIIKRLNAYVVIMIIIIIIGLITTVLFDVNKKMKEILVKKILGAKNIDILYPLIK